MTNTITTVNTMNIVLNAVEGVWIPMEVYNRLLLSPNVLLLAEKDKRISDLERMCDYSDDDARCARAEKNRVLRDLEIVQKKYVEICQELWVISTKGE